MSTAQPRPGSLVSVRTGTPPRTIPTDTAMWFIVGITDRGLTLPQDVASLSDFIKMYGDRQTYSILYDAVEAFFREGGSRIKMNRVVGPSPVIAHVGLLDTVPSVCMTVYAKGPGVYANAYSVTVAGSVAGGTKNFTIINDNTGEVLEVSPPVLTQQAVLAWSQKSEYVDIVLGVSSGMPANISAAPLANGTDDRTNIADAQWAAALTGFSKDLGPGQVSAPGRTSTTGHAQVLTHAANNNRFALLDLPDSPTVATVEAAPLAQRSDTTVDGSYGMGFAPWIVVPGIVPGPTRVVPPSALAAAKIAVSQANGNSPNAPAAASNGISSWAIGLSQDPYDNGNGIDATRDEMYSKGVNLVINRYGLIEVFGWRTLVDPNGIDQDWLNAGNARLRMAIIAQCLKVAESYILKEIDGRGLLFKSFQGDLTGVLMQYYPTSLFGDTPEEAFVVDVGPTVNTPTTIANQELHAAIGVRMSPDSELVVIEITKVSVTQAL